MGSNHSKRKPNTYDPLWLRDEVSMGAWEKLQAETDASGKPIETETTGTTVSPDRTLHDHRKYVFPFENLAFEGGGAKGMVYAGALKCLDEAGVKPKRVAGTSAGAITATLVAAGFSPEEVKELSGSNLEDMLLDHKWGVFSFIPSMLSSFGWNSATKFYDFLGETLKKKLGNADVTFSQIHELTGVELCITGFNVNMMTLEYFHPKITPTMKVRDAVRISMSIPGVFKAVQLPHPSGFGADYYVDGGFANNYPVHVFDGWFLSMAQEDNFFNKMPVDNELDPYQLRKDMYGQSANPNTLGFVVHKDGENELMKVYLNERTEPDPVTIPSTKLARQYSQKDVDDKKQAKEMMLLWKAIVRLVKVFKGLDEAGQTQSGKMSDKISRAAFLVVVERARNMEGAVCEVSGLKKLDIQLLFGETDLDEIFTAIDKSGNGLVSFYELLNYFERHGFLFKKLFLGYDRREVDGLLSFFTAIGSGLMNNSQKTFSKIGDVNRTVGINTGYVGTLDFKLSPDDQEFMMQSGYETTRAYLHDWINKHSPPMKE